MIDNNLKDCREDLDMTQTDLGKVLGVSKFTICNWEKGRDTMPFGKMIKFCNLYDYSLDMLMGFKRRNIRYGSFDTGIENIATRLKEFRKEFGLSQQKLADDCKISRSTYAGYEACDYLISTLTVYSICKKYNISADWLCGRTDKKYIDDEKK